MKYFRNPRFYSDGTPGVGLLLLRAFLGYAMMMHSLGKIGHPFSWMDQGPQPSGVPGFLQALGAAGEFAGGLGLAFGLLTPIAALGVMSTMFVAVLFLLAHAPSPHYFIKPQGVKDGSDYESAAMYFIFALTIFLTGPGLLSVDAFLFGRKNEGAPQSVAPVKS